MHIFCISISIITFAFALASEKLIVSAVKRKTSNQALSITEEELTNVSSSSNDDKSKDDKTKYDKSIDEKSIDDKSIDDKSIDDKSIDTASGYDWNQLIPATKRGLWQLATSLNLPFFPKSPHQCTDCSDEEWSGQLVDLIDFNGDKMGDLILISDGIQLEPPPAASVRALLPWPFNIWFPTEKHKKKHVVSDGNKYLTIHLWDDGGTYKEGSRVQIPNNVTSVITTDWNYDGNVDVIAIGSSIKGDNHPIYSLHAYLHEANSSALTAKWSSKDLFSDTHPFIVDINGDGREDIIVQVKREDATEESKYERAVWINNPKNIYELHMWNSLVKNNMLSLQSAKGKVQYTFPTTDGNANLNDQDKTPELKTLPATDRTLTKLTTAAASTAIVDDTATPIPETLREWRRIASPHSSAFVDIDGDCRADIVIEVESVTHVGRRELEIWLNDGMHFESYNDAHQSALYRLDETNKIILPEGAGQVSYADIDGDGAIDLIIPVCDRDEVTDNSCKKDSSRIYTALNQQVPTCQSGFLGRDSDDKNCRNVNALCIPSEFRFADFSDLKESKLDSGINISPLTAEGHQLNFVGDDIHNPITVRIGDRDSDGYPDMVVIATNSSAPLDYKTVVVIFRNTPVKTEKDGNVDVSDYQILNDRMSSFTYEHSIQFGKELENLELHNAAFIDVEENGIFDVIATGVAGSDSRPITLISLASDTRNLIGDNLFLKATSFNGVDPINRELAKTKSWWRRHPPSKGVTPHGPTFKATATDIWNTKTARVATLLPQSAHNPLGLPFVYFGLGRTNNYVDELYYGMPIQPLSPLRPNHKTEQFQNNYTTDFRFLSYFQPCQKWNCGLYSSKWTSIIPNSQVLCVPYHLNSPDEWVIELSVSPSHLLAPIVLATTTCLAVIGGLVWFLNNREKAEDNREHQGFRRHFITA